MRRAFLFLLSLAACLAQADETRIIVIKADDVRGVHPKWQRFFELTRELGVKASAGVIADTLEKPDPAYQEWLKKWDEGGTIEFWNHGWDHKRWEEDGKTLSEFGGSGYEHQKTHLTKTQDAGKNALGKDFITFGSPFNAMDEDTVKALNEIPELRLVFCYPGHPATKQLEDKILLPMVLRGEHDGTGKPNFEKFKADYAEKHQAKPKLSALQVHPAGFSEEGFQDFASIVEFLKNEGWIFLLPSEYAAIGK